MIHQLPGTDPRFHESRNYLAIVVVEGIEILASHGSCKEEGCGYRRAWKSNAARNLGMWNHRAAKVREARLRYFIKTMGLNPTKALDLLIENSDCNTHTYGLWVAQVNHFLTDLSGSEIDELPTYDYRVQYDLGRSAKEVASEILDRAVTPR